MPGFACFITDHLKTATIFINLGERVYHAPLNL